METSPVTPELSRNLETMNQLLDGLPPGMVEAKRYIAEAARWEPAPQVLQCMVKIADDEAEGGPRREIPRNLLALRTLADKRFTMILDGDPPDTETLLSSARILSRLHHDLNRIEKELKSSLPELSEEDRRYLSTIHKALAPPREKFLVAGTLARAARLPGDPETDGTDDLCREGRHATALLRLIRSDLASWEECDGDESRRNRIWAALELDRNGYKPLSASLSEAKDRAFAEQRRADHVALDNLQRELFAEYSRLSRTLATGKHPVEERAPDLSGLESSIAEAEAAADAMNEERRHKRELVENAVHGLKTTEATRPVPPDFAARDERTRANRLRILVSLLCLLAVAAVAVNLALAPKKIVSPQLSPEEFHTAIPLQETVSAGTLMTARTSDSLWSGWSERERADLLDDLVRQAEAKGFTSLVLTSDTGRQLAFWQKGTEPQVY